MFDDLSSTENKGCLWWLVYSVVCVILAVGFVGVLGFLTKTGVDFLQGGESSKSLQETLSYLKNSTFGSSMKNVTDFFGDDKENK